MSNETKHILVISSCPGSITAKQVAQDLVANNLAACVNCFSGITSYFTWGNKLEISDEHILFIKTTTDRYPQVEKTITSLHPYELPEIIAVPIEAGLQGYLDWIVQNTK